jgi:predicted DNA-binding protein (MmcQ/YjbR family)
VTPRRRPASSYEARIRELALSFPETREDHPFGPETHVFKVGGGSTMFVIMGDGPLRVTVKLTREEREIALQLHFVSEAKYVGRYGWVTATVEDDEALEATLEWVRESYWVRAPERVREAAWED